LPQFEPVEGPSLALERLVLAILYALIEVA
jgi:hypothetical protein